MRAGKAPQPETKASARIANKRELDRLAAENTELRARAQALEANVAALHGMLVDAEVLRCEVDDLKQQREKLRRTVQYFAASAPEARLIAIRAVVAEQRARAALQSRLHQLAAIIPSEATANPGWGSTTAPPSCAT